MEYITQFDKKISQQDLRLSSMTYKATLITTNGASPARLSVKTDWDKSIYFKEQPQRTIKVS